MSLDLSDHKAVAAEAQRRRELVARGVTTFAEPRPAGIDTPSDAAMRAQLEKQHEAEGDRLMLALGFEVVRLSEARKTKKTPGVPDRKYYHRRRRLTLWWEAKASSGTQRPDQRVFQEMAEACGETYVLGTLEALKSWLVDQGIATRDGDLLIPTPIP